MAEASPKSISLPNTSDNTKICQMNSPVLSMHISNLISSNLMLITMITIARQGLVAVGSMEEKARFGKEAFAFHSSFAAQKCNRIHGAIRLWLDTISFQLTVTGQAFQKRPDPKEPREVA